jgi:hypothetical protein
MKILLTRKETPFSKPRKFIPILLIGIIALGVSILIHTHLAPELTNIKYIGLLGAFAIITAIR